MLVFRRLLSPKLHIRRAEILKYLERTLEVKRVSEKLFRKYLPGQTEGWGAG